MDPIFAQIAQIFCDESKDQAQRISEALLNAGGDANSVKQAIEKVFREAHSLKGSASSLGVTDIEHVAQAIEDALGPVRAGRAELTSDLVDACLCAVDAIIERCTGSSLSRRALCCRSADLMHEATDHSRTAVQYGRGHHNFARPW